MAIGPDELKRAHRASIAHRTAVVASRACGCFYCLARFAPTEIKAWADAGETALCPRCGVDAVLGDGCATRVDAAFLAAMRRHWFGG